LVDQQETIEDLTKKGINMLVHKRLGTIVNSEEEILEILANGHALIAYTFKTNEHI